MAFRIDEFIPVLHELHDNKFYGSLEVVYQDGEIQLYKKTETVKAVVAIAQIKITGSST